MSNPTRLRSKRASDLLLDASYAGSVSQRTINLCTNTEFAAIGNGLDQAEKFFYDRRTQKSWINNAAVAIGSKINERLGKIRFAFHESFDGDTVGIK